VYMTAGMESALNLSHEDYQVVPWPAEAQAAAAETR
jgi:hypothetical protein